MSIKYSEREKGMIRLYKKCKNMAEVAREFRVSREWVRQFLNSRGIDIKKKGSQGDRKLSTHGNKGA